MIFTINDCSIDTHTYEVRRHGKLISVEPQVFDLLVLLTENRDRVVTREELIATIWNGRVVSEAALSSRIKAARKVVGDDGARQSCIRTIRGRGYRVIADVQEGPGTGKDPVRRYADRGALERVASGGDREAAAAERRHPSGQIVPLVRRALGKTGLGRLINHYTVVAAAIVCAVFALFGGWSAFEQLRNSPLRIASAAYGMPKGPDIAVHGFTNLSNDPTLDFFGDAITEEIVTELTRFSELRVTNSAAAQSRKGVSTDAPHGAATGVAYVLRGSLRRSSERVRVTAQLLKAADGALVWAETHERRFTPIDILTVQTDIATKVVASIASISSGVIARDSLGGTRGTPPRELSAYDCTVRASGIVMSGFTASSHLAARNCLEAVVASEPDYATAWAMLAWTHSVEYTQDFNKRPGLDPRESALLAARRAVELAPANPMARFAMARAAYLKGDLSVFYAEAANALRLNPHEPFLLGSLGSWLSFTGRWDEGVPLVKKAMALSPNAYPRWWHMAIAKDHYRRRDFPAALDQFKKVNHPNWWLTHMELAYTYAQLGDVANARSSVARLLEFQPDFDLGKAVREHEKYGFEQSYIDLVLDGLRKAGIPEISPLSASR